MRRTNLPIYVVVAAMITLFVATTISCAAANVGETPEAILKKISESRKKYTYKAVGSTYLSEGGKKIVSEIKIYHEPHKSRIEYLTPPLRGVVVGNDEKQSWRVDPKLRRVVVMDRPAPSGRELNVGLLLKNHKIDVIDGGKVAGRPCTELVIRSKAGVVRRRRWVDNLTHVVLRTEDYNAAGKMISYTEFKSISYMADLPDSLFLRPGPADKTNQTRQHIAARRMDLAALSREVGFRVSLPKYLPAGYKFDSGRLLIMPKQGRKAAYLRYTNGLDSISIFEAFKGSDSLRKEFLRVQTGRLMRRGERLRMSVESKGNMTFVVIGEFNHVELDRIADSIPGLEGR